jgi:hypothetical protein
VTSSEYVGARRALLDALQALQSHIDALVLVGAQAVYLHTGDGELPVSPTTTDADLAINATLLSDDPNIVQALVEAGFKPVVNKPGTWRAPNGVLVDLMVPEALVANTGGRRGARLGPHGKNVARKTAGLEPAIIDYVLKDIRSLEPEIDARAFNFKVAGPAALLVAKLTKVRERAATPARLQAKDGLDVFRILQKAETETIAASLDMLAANELAGEVTQVAVDFLRSDGTDPDGVLVQLAVQATELLVDPRILTDSFIALVEDLLDSLGTRS